MSVVPWWWIFYRSVLNAKFGHPSHLFGLGSLHVSTRQLVLFVCWLHSWWPCVSSLLLPLACGLHLPACFSALHGRFPALHGRFLALGLWPQDRSCVTFLANVIQLVLLSLWWVFITNTTLFPVFHPPRSCHFLSLSLVPHPPLSYSSCFYLALDQHPYCWEWTSFWVAWRSRSGGTVRIFGQESIRRAQ